MIISRTPFRVSFLGGGTDLKEFWQEEEGAVLSTSIDKYMHITVNRRFDQTYRLSYSKTEICNSADEFEKIEHRIFKAVLLRYREQINQKTKGGGLEILSMADIPSGTGLGSSSSFTVALLHALKSELGLFQSPSQLASEASEFEIDILGEPIGKQDQYAAAFGGLRLIRFLPSGEVSAEPVIAPPGCIQALQDHMMLFYTGITRSASQVLSTQKSKTAINRETLREMRNLAFKMKAALEQGQSMRTVAEFLAEGWRLKKTLASGISVSTIDQAYDRAVKAGAFAGKILGAGGGGFLMLLCPPDKQKSVIHELSDLRYFPVKMDPFGSRILFVDDVAVQLR